MSEFDSLDAIRFRLFGLPGGAKNNDVVVGKLKAMLQARGVSAESVGGRATMILNKIPASELAPILNNEENTAWSLLKTRANDAKIRMILPVELRDHQKAQRKTTQIGKNKRKDMSKATSSDPKGNAKKEVLTPSRVVIDPCHFHAKGDKIAVLDLSLWGPDQTGITIATPSEASKLLPVTRLSCDPLAMVVVTNSDFNGASPVAIPATDTAGNPVVAKVVVINFGDVHVTCEPRLPRVEIEETPTTTLEVTIVRKMIKDRKSVV